MTDEFFSHLKVCVLCKRILLRKRILLLVSGRWCSVALLLMHVLLRFVCLKVSVWNSFNGVLEQFDSVVACSRNQLLLKELGVVRPQPLS